MNGYHGTKFGKNNREIRKLDHWKPLLHQWQLCFTKYCEVIQGDTPCLNKERANIGLLAAAAWQHGLIALEEWPNQKRGDKDGRNDLWICDNDLFNDYIEAKWTYLNIDKQNYLNDAKWQLESALRDADEVKTFGENPRKIGVSFLCVSLHKRCLEESSLQQILQQCISNLTGCLESPDIISWVFPDVLRNFIDGERLFPGIVLLASKVAI